MAAALQEAILGWAALVVTGCGLHSPQGSNTSMLAFRRDWCHGLCALWTTGPVRLCKRVSQKLVSILLLTTGKRTLPFQTDCWQGNSSVRILPKLRKLVGVQSVLCVLSWLTKSGRKKIGHKRLSSSNPLYFFAGCVHTIIGIGETHSALQHIVGHSKPRSCVSHLLAWWHLFLEES